jgi:opacity protein-like surface antigen
MKKLLVVFALLGLTSTIFAESHEQPATSSLRKAGIYLGLQGGYGMTHWKYLEGSTYRGGITNVKNDRSGVSRAFLGYDINRYFAFEAGYSYFFSRSNILYVDGVTTGDIRLQTVDLYGKIKAPIGGFDLYAKLGGGYLRETSSLNRSLNNVSVAFGAGIEYYINRIVIVGFEWLRIGGDANATVKYIPNTDTFMIGLRFKL